MTSAVLNNSVDAYVDQALPNQNFTNTKKLYVKKGSGPSNAQNAYIYFTRPFPVGARIISAKLFLRNGTDLDGPSTRVDVKRIDGPWRADKITWNNRPSLGGAEYSVTKTGAVAKGTTWEFNITEMMQTIADGGVEFYGFRFTCNDGAGDWFHGIASGTGTARPRLEITWVIPPQPPTSLEPANGRIVATPKPLLTFNYTADSDIDQLAVEITPNTPGGGGGYASGWKASATPQFDINTQAGGFALTSGLVYYWRVKIKTLDGQESGWSDWAEFGYQVMPGLNIVDPSGAEVHSSTPQIAWTVSGTAQRHYQVFLIDPELGPEHVIWTNGRTTGTETAIVLPDNILDFGKTYKVRVQVWDVIDRAKTGDFPPYATAERTFSVTFDPSEAPVTDLTGTRVAPWHWTQLDWERAVAPTWFDVYLGNVAIARLDPDDIRQPDGSYRYVARVAHPREDAVWKVVAVTGYDGSDNNPTVTTNFANTSACLSELDGSNPLFLLNYTRDQDEESNATVHETVGGAPPVLIKQGKSRIVGTITAGLFGSAIPGVSAKQEKQRFNALRAGEGRNLLLTALDETIICFITNTNIVSRSDAEGIYYQIEFDYYQTAKK